MEYSYENRALHVVSPALRPSSRDPNEASQPLMAPSPTVPFPPHRSPPPPPPGRRYSNDSHIRMPGTAIYTHDERRSNQSLASTLVQQPLGTYQKLEAQSSVKSSDAFTSLEQRCRHWSLRMRPYWLFEILCATISVCSLAAIVGLLAAYDNKPLTDWRFVLSLNTVVSILGTISKAALSEVLAASISQSKWLWFARDERPLNDFADIEDASRGAWGSLGLLCSKRWKSTASFGAVIVVLTIATDPFFQSLIAYHGELDVSTTSQRAYLPSTQHIDAGIQLAEYYPVSHYNDTGNIYPAEYCTFPDFEVMAGFTSGLQQHAGRHQFQNLQFSCPSGNCTWPTFATLGISSMCIDVSDQLYKTTYNSLSGSAMGSIPDSMASKSLTTVTVTEAPTTLSVPMILTTETVTIGPFALNGTVIHTAPNGTAAYNYSTWPPFSSDRVSFRTSESTILTPAFKSTTATYGHTSVQTLHHTSSVLTDDAGTFSEPIAYAFSSALPSEALVSTGAQSWVSVPPTTSSELPVRSKAPSAILISNLYSSASSAPACGVEYYLPPCPSKRAVRALDSTTLASAMYASASQLYLKARAPAITISNPYSSASSAAECGEEYHMTPCISAQATRAVNSTAWSTSSTTYTSEPLPSEGAKGNAKADAGASRTFYHLHGLEYPYIWNNDGPINRSSSPDIFRGAYMTTSMTSDPKQTINFRSNQTLLAAYQLIKAADSYREGSKSWPNVQLQATECGLFLDARAIKASVEAGSYREEMLQSWSVKAPESWQTSSSDHYVRDPSQLWSHDYNPIYHAEYVRRSPFQLTIPSDNPWGLPSNVSASQRFLESTIEMLKKAMIPDPSRDLDGQPAVYETGTMVYTADVMQPLYHSEDLSHTFSNVGSSMTVAMRNRAGSNTAGSVQAYVVHIRIQWLYLIFPILVILGGICTLALAMYQTKRLRVAAWQGNMYATLLHGLDSETRSQLRAAAVEDGMQEACDRRVKLINRYDGCELRGT